MYKQHRKLPALTLASALLFLPFAARAQSAPAAGDRIVRAGHPVRGEYIVVLKDALPGPIAKVAEDLAGAHGGRVLTLYETLFRGFWVQMTDEQAQALSRNPLVKWVEENAELSLAASQSIVPAPPNTASLWALDRIDQYVPSTDRVNNTFNYCTNGAGVRAYVVDTGVMPFHKELNGRVDPAPSLTTLLNNSRGPQCWNQNSFSATASHGTAVAALIGGNTYGVAKGVTIVDARAADCYGSTTSAVLNQVLGWIPTDPNRGSAPRVVNMSLSGPTSLDPSGNSAVKTSINSLVNDYNIPVVVSAGNFNADSSLYTPASATRAITVAGLNQGSDTRWQYSNYGGNVSLYAPAQYVESASTVVTEKFPTISQDWKRSELSDCPSYPDTCTSGTSFSAPLTTGVVARYLQRHPGATRDQVLSYLYAESATHSGAQVADPSGRSIPILDISDCPATFTTQTPASFISASPGYEVATRFISSVPGSITALRFYKAPGETGSHTIRLWTDGGALLAAVTVANETASGWQEQALPSPIAISAGVYYRVSHNTNTWQSKTNCGLQTSITNGPLTAQSGAWISPNGAFPTTGSCSNFFGDVRFDQWFDQQ